MSKRNKQDVFDENKDEHNDLINSSNLRKNECIIPIQIENANTQHAQKKDLPRQDVRGSSKTGSHVEKTEIDDQIFSSPQPFKSQELKITPCKSNTHFTSEHVDLIPSFVPGQPYIIRKETTTEDTKSVDEKQKAINCALNEVCHSYQSEPNEPNICSEKSKYNIKSLLEVVTEQDKFFKIYTDYKGRYDGSVDNILKTIGKPHIKEKIIFIIDTGTDENSTPFLIKEGVVDTLSLIKYKLKKYVELKSGEIKYHEFAIILLNANAANMYLDFTDNLDLIKSKISSINECSEVEDVFNFNQVFDILRNIPSPNIDQKGSELPEYIIHPIMFFLRSYTIPVYDKEEYKDLLNAEHFFLDIILSHEIVGAENNVKIICDKFQDMLNKNGSLIPIGRNLKRLHHAFNRAFGNPYQRALQILKD